MEEQQSRYKHSSWIVHMTSGDRFYTSTGRNLSLRVRAVSVADERVAYDISFDSIVEAFEDCCKKKKTSNDYLQFLPNCESKMVDKWNYIRYENYTPGKSKTFVSDWPVSREIFAADFADRIIHHWWALRVNPLFEERFTEQGDVSKNCRVGQGVHVAVKEAQIMLDEHPDWWVGRFDLEGFFMSIDKALLYEMLDIFIRDNYKGDDIECLLYSALCATEILTLCLPPLSTFAGTINAFKVAIFPTIFRK